MKFDLVSLAHDIRTGSSKVQILMRGLTSESLCNMHVCQLAPAFDVPCAFNEIISFESGIIKPYMSDITDQFIDDHGIKYYDARSIMELRKNVTELYE